MNYKSSLISITLAISTLFTSIASGKDYAIEIILFANKDGLQQTAEQFTANHAIPTPTNGISLDTVDDESLWQPIPEDQYILADVANNLKRSGRYRILKHIAWRQPVVERKDSQPITIRAGRDFSDQFPERAYRHVEFSDTASDSSDISNEVKELAGTINIVITRYIHLYSDLVYRLPRPNPTALNDALDRELVLVDYAVNSHRRMRSRELHYIDHPLVGILIEATPIEDENDEN